LIKLLHSADWHLDAPLQLGGALRDELAKIPEKVVSLCQEQGCQMLLLSGDLFDGVPTPDTVHNLKRCLGNAGVPVFIAPGNHDHMGVASVWLTESWPENVHVFTKNVVESVAIPELDCRVYGAGFTSMDCDGLLEGFTAEGTENYKIGVFHGDPTQVTSPYCPITTAQVQFSNLDYLALGHIHKGGSFRAGKTLCAWPGCPMGRGYDEEGEKGVLVVTLEEAATTRFVPLDTPRFYDLEVDIGDDAAAALASVLPPVGNNDYYRITFVGAGDAPDLDALKKPEFPNLVLRDKTVPLVDIWSSAGEDTFDGMYFGQLQKAMEDADENTKRQIRLAAQISRKILEGQEVVLP